MQALARAVTATALLALSAALPAQHAAADPVDDAIATVDFVLCPAPEVDLCLTYPFVTWTACPLLAGLQPGVPGAVDIRPDGDVYVAGHWVWECPPYGG